MFRSCKMAGTQDLKTQELNFIFKALGQRGKEIGKISRLILKHHSQLFTKLRSNDIIFEPSGSSIEEVMCYNPNQPGDVDIMIFPNSDNLMMHDRLIEYLPEHPMHVRIKGIGHPVLQSCLVEGTEYVATSAVKNFHDAIYGGDCYTGILQQIASREDLALNTGQFHTSGTSPALTFTFFDNFVSTFSGSLPSWRDYEELIIKDGPENLQLPLTSDPAEWEWLAHWHCTTSGTDYTKEKARMFDDMVQAMNEVFISAFNSYPSDISQMASEILRGAENLKAQLQDIESSPENNSEGRKKFLETETKGIMAYQSEDDQNRDTDGNQNEQKTEPQSFAIAQLVSKDKPRNPDEEENEVKSLPRITRHLFQYIVGLIAESTEDPFKEAELKNIDEAQFNELVEGIDFVPALRSRGWPKVALEWIERERRWPSPDIVDKVVQGGFHLVVKPPKNGGNPDCDFRISFSHAEYLLSQELNEIQRDCYRCLKNYHRAYLSKEPKGLVTFHLKNMFLQTIEETGDKMWTESNRATCMMKLLANLLEALTKKDLRHFFVRSYNLFCVDYIECPEILESLAEKTEQIMKNPLQFAKGLISGQEARQNKNETECILSGEVTSSAASATRHGHKEIVKDPTKRNDEDQGKQAEAMHKGSSSRTSYRYHDLQDIFLATSNELINMAANDVDCRLETLDPLERSLVEDLREIGRIHNINADELFMIFESGWKMIYTKVWLSTEPNMRLRMLDGIQGVVGVLKYMLRQDNAVLGKNGAVLAKMLDCTSENPFDFSHVLPANLGLQLFRRMLKSLKPAEPQKVNMEDIPLD